MLYQLVKTPQSYCKSFWMILILIFVGLTFINYKVERFDNKKSKKSNTYNLGVCSKNCCATQWQVPINLTENSGVTKEMVGSKYFTSNLTCNNGTVDTGCVCLTPASKKMLGSRGYVQNLPTGNGLLEQDNRKSAFKIMEEKVKDVSVMGQTTELTGSKNNSREISGRSESSTYRSVESDKEIATKYSMPINNNIISWDNGEINNALSKSNISTNIVSDTDKLLSRQIGFDSKYININRK